MIEKRNGKTIISTPVSAAEIASLHIGDVFYLDGEMVTGRDSVHARVVIDGQKLPADIKDKVIMHAGPIVRVHNENHSAPAASSTSDAPHTASSSSDAPHTVSYEMISIGPTTSMRMERFEYEFIQETGARIIIGKGGMKERTSEACKQFGAVHCVLPAGNAVIGAACVEEITAVHWLDLGMPEAVWCCRVKELGPLIVTIDSEGRNYFEEKKRLYEQRKEEQIREISSQVHFLK